MAMNTNEGRVQYEASSGQTAFDFNFAIFENTDLLVYNTPTGQTPNDTTDILIVNTDYTVTIDGTDGGQVVLVSPATLNDVITIVRSLPIERNYDYQANGDLYADTLDSDQEYQTYLIKDGDTLLKRSVTLPQSYGGDVDLTMPPPVANGYFKYNAAGTAIEIDATIYQAVASVGGNIQDVVAVGDDLNATYSHILHALDNATTATTNAATATTQAGIAITQASLAVSTYDDFDDRYLGSKTLDPTVDNDGNTLLVGAIYWNSSYKQIRVWSGSEWVATSTGSGATGGGTDKVFYENGNTVTTSYAITANHNAMSAGTITVNDGVTVTVPSGSSWTIV